MEHGTQLIVMLTQHDCTVRNAYEIFDQCKHSKVKFWGFKEKPLPLDQMKALYSYMKEYGKTTFLEVVAYTEEEGLHGAKIAAECGCDVLLGTLFSDSINQFCQKNHLKYMPFVGTVTGRPSVLNGAIDEMIQEACFLLKQGVYGVDLLGYRYTQDASLLIKRFVSEVPAPVCIAGSINSYSRLKEIKESAPWAFTIGGAFFENTFGDSFGSQLDNVCRYIDQ